MQQRNTTAINGTQKNIIEGTLKFYLDDIRNLKPAAVIQALNAITQLVITQEESLIFKQQNVFDTITAIRGILFHPYPQNRSTSYPYFHDPLDSTMVVYKDDKGKPAFEKRGLLSLTARNDQTALPVTKEAVVQYIHQLINETLLEQHKKLSSDLVQPERTNEDKEKKDVAVAASNAVLHDHPISTANQLLSSQIVVSPEYWADLQDQLAAIISSHTSDESSTYNSPLLFLPDADLDTQEPSSHQSNNGVLPTNLREVEDTIYESDDEEIFLFSFASLRRRPFRFFSHQPDYQTSVASCNESIMRDTVQVLRAYGLHDLTVSYLRENWVPPSMAHPAPFNKNEENTLIYLVTGQAPAPLRGVENTNIPNLPLEQRLTIKQALDEIAKLSYDQVSVLMTCYRYGLRGDHLRNWQAANGRLFTGGYEDALKYLIIRGNVPPAEAVQRISGITQEQAWDIMRDIHPRHSSHSLGMR